MPGGEAGNSPPLELLWTSIEFQPSAHEVQNFATFKFRAAPWRAGSGVLARISRSAPTIKELRLLLLARQAMQHRASALRRQRIFIQRRPDFTQPTQPTLPLGAELRLQLLTQTLSQRSAVPCG